MEEIMKKLIPFVFVALLAGCSTFDADYARQAALATNSTQPVEGAWIGRWQSNAGHGGGELRAVITPADKAAIAADRTYSAAFKAKWGFFTSEYTTPMTGHSDLKSSSVKVHAETNLGVMIGNYSMDGTSTATTISAKYKAAGDEGTIELKRP
jgi:hypothetical protein